MCDGGPSKRRRAGKSDDDRRAGILHDGRLKALIDASFGSFFMLEARRGRDRRIVDFVIREVNAAGAEMAGRPAASLRGLGLGTVLSPHSLALRMADYRQVMDSGTPATFEVRCEADEPRVLLRNLHPGETAWISQRVAPLADGVAVTIRDITREKRNELFLESRGQTLEALAAGAPLLSVLEALTLSIERIFPGMRCSILLVDPQTKTLRHGAAPSLPASYIAAVDGIEIGPNIGSCAAAAFLGELVVAGDVNQHPNWRNYRDLARQAGIRACWSQPIFSAKREVLGTLALYYSQPRDPSPAELEIVNSGAHLASVAISHAKAEEVAELALAKALLANEAKSAFLGNMSHELRTPLNAIIGFADLLLLQVKGELSQAQRGYSENIRASGAHLLSLVEDLLDLARIERGVHRISTEPVLLSGAIESALALLEPLADARRISLAPEVAERDLSVLADERSMRQILTNLIENAVKFSPEGSRVVVRGALDRQGRPVVSVRDRGAGIPGDAIGAISRPVGQAGAPLTLSRQGAGLGLQIVSELTRLHQAELVIDSEAGKGTCVSVVFPAAAHVGRRAAVCGAPTAPDSGRTSS